MGFAYLTNVPLDRARGDYLAWLEENGFSGRTETVPVPEACGRVTARAVYAAICAPHYAASAMDGVALDARDTFGATETTPVTLPAGKYAVVDTGDPVPAGCDAVVMVEDLVRNADGSVTLHAAAAPWQHIRQIGEDVCAGEMILPAYTEVTPAAIGALLAGGVLALEAVARPVVGIIPTGDELVPPRPDPGPGEILEFNSAIFSAMLRQWGAEARTYPIVPDRFGQLRDAVARAATECDVVLLNAGSSAGREDHAAAVLRALGEVLYHGVAMKPGKPAILGRVGQTPVLGVPGYPVSGILVIEELLRPLLARWTRTPAPPPRHARATLARAVVSGLKYEEFVRVRMGHVGGRLVASPLARGSGVVTSFMRADGILAVPQGTEGYEAGSEVEVRLLSPMEKLENTLVVIGSHDPLLDELADLMHREDGSVWMSSAHVGSMGGIMALRRGEAHAAGCHLLDTETGEYNVSFLRKYFPRGDVRLLRCVGRQQGLLVAAGNPLGLAGFADLARPGLRYVNRQKGSGTRILADYLCKREGLDPDAVYGYDREELTHTSVAAQIAGGSADAGMGVYAAAKLYGLDFLPLCEERYDLIIPDYAWDTPQVRRLVETLRGPAFRARLAALGGYTVQDPGEPVAYL